MNKIEIKNIAFAITAIVVSTMLLTSCVLIPPDFTSDTQKSTATETKRANKNQTQ